MTSHRQFAVMAAMAVVTVQAEQKPQMTARELFYVPAATAAPAPAQETRRAAARPVVARPAVKAAPKKAAEENAETVTVAATSYEGPRPLGLRYSVQRMGAGQDPREVPVDSTFRSGDSVGIAVEANEPGYLYVVARGSSGKWQVMFPSAEINAGDNWVEGGHRYTIPPGSHVWTFDDRKGTEKLFVVLARQEVADLEALIYDLNQPAKPAPKPAAKPVTAPSAPVKKENVAAVRPVGTKPLMLAQSATPIDDALVGKLRSQVLPRDLIVEKVAHKEYALYAVEKSGKPDARLVVDVELRHE